jgi:hypothetical protein
VEWKSDNCRRSSHASSIAVIHRRRPSPVAGKVDRISIEATKKKEDKLPIRPCCN